MQGQFCSSHEQQIRVLECRIQSGEWLGEVGGLEAGAWSLGDMQSSLWGAAAHLGGAGLRCPPRSKSNIHISLLPEIKKSYPPNKTSSKGKIKFPVTSWLCSWALAPGGVIPTRLRSLHFVWFFVCLFFWLPETHWALQAGRKGPPAHLCFLRYSCSAFSATVSINLGFFLETSTGTVTVMGSESKSFTTTSVTPEGTSESELWEAT